MLAKTGHNANSDAQMVQYKYTVSFENNLTLSSEAEISIVMAQQFHYKLYTLEKLLYMFNRR